MASSDDEDLLVPQAVTNYHFEDVKGEPITFSVLPLCFDSMEKTDAPKEQVTLRGNGDGLQSVYIQVTAWKLELEDAQPEVLVLSKYNKWIKLLKPRKIYEESVRTIFITIQVLHILRRESEMSEKSLWDQLRRIFSSFEDPPSVNDLVDHYPLMKTVMERDDALTKSQLLLMLLEEKPRKTTIGQDLQHDLDPKKSFIADDEDVEEDVENDDGYASEEDACAICDNGGDLLCCEGRCMRSFHATRKDGEDSHCKSLGFSEAQFAAIQNFVCKNCEYKQHQCFVCWKLGSSDKSSGAEVFACANATCGYFYHPKCVADLLLPENKTEAAEYEKKIAAGESFACPVHKCHACKQGEDKAVEELQFAVCRRCPRSYHRRCLPRKIAFEDIAEEEGIAQRAWEGLLPKRILIYCLKHKIDEDLGTPIRNHIKFPEAPEMRNIVDVQKNKAKVPVKKNSDGLPHERTFKKPIKAAGKISSCEGSQLATKRKNTEQVVKSQKPLKRLKVSAEPDWHESAPLEIKKSPKGKANIAVPVIKSASTGKVAISSYPKIDVETEKKMIAIMESTPPSLTKESIIKKRTMPLTHMHTQSARNIDQTITLGKVEGSVEAVKTALKRLEDGGNVEDAKTVCEPDVLNQILKWNNKLKVYLAPFLHGMRYTSFGRHFTKIDKLKEITNKLQWYVQNGDTIVDFCCGANDFSRLMKEKLDATGKKCSFKNYDCIQPKNDFCFEKRDWMTVKPEELPTGSQLIMGLNPPFGVKAGLANKFINRALLFKPKLLILIVPSETERLDQKPKPYDLIWEDNEKLAGKSFYLPGSVDVNDMQMEQWNNKPPPLYLWSRPDWTSKHKTIALKQGHIKMGHQERPTEREIENKEAISPDKEGDKEKIASDIKKASPPENITSSRNRRRRKPKRPKMVELKRTEKDVNVKNVFENSDMSISPPNNKEISSGQETIETPRESIQTNANSVVEDIHDIARRYTTNYNNTNAFENRDYMIRNSEERSSGYSNFENNSGDNRMGDRDYMIRKSEEKFTGYSNFDNNSGGNRMGDRDCMIRNSEERLSGYNSFNNNYSRSPYVENYSSQRSMFSPGVSDISSSYGASSSSMAGSSIMQRYAPRLDETNFLRGPGGPVPGAQGPGMHGMMRGPGIPGLGVHMPPGPFGFVPGPQHHFQRHNSGGSWLDDEVTYK